MTSGNVPSVPIQTRERWYASFAFATYNDAHAAAVLLTMICCPHGRVPSLASVGPHFFDTAGGPVFLMLAGQL